jgi:hypothetical protein
VSGDALRRAAATYLGELPDEWHEGEAESTSGELVERIRG